jgi:HEAT repeat protein
MVFFQVMSPNRTTERLLRSTKGKSPGSCRGFIALLMVIVIIGSVYSDESTQPVATKRLAILQFGIESQVIELLSTLAGEKNDDFKQEILKVFDASTSPKLKASILDYMRTMKIDLAIDRAGEIIRLRDNSAESMVTAAFSYLVALESKQALAESITIIKENETRYIQAAIKVLGTAGSDDEVTTLKDLFEAEGTGDAIKEQVVLALGSMKAKSSYDLLAEILSSEESSKTLRMYACTALGSLGDNRAIPVLVKASVVADPNVRTYAIAALGKFTDAESMLAVREALRDPHVLARTAAAKSSALTHDSDAIPYLEFKVTDDPERSVREASMDALAEIGGGRAERFLSDFVADTKNQAAFRGAAFGALVRKGRSAEFERLVSVFKSAQAEKERSFFTILARTLVTVDVPDAKPFIAILMADSDFQMRLGAVAWIDRNRALSLLEGLRSLAEHDPAEAVRRRAAQAVERLGS